ncbi:hypothetical protein [Rhizobium sp. RCAM05973]|uniref:hypothetical protein n=1 Tax=Rhizobium sp. RCAM05973 TaxID=2994066 RepID=UPI0022EC0CE1|nr:hypothetical protein [Rhizobium sp. RCAM05973]
MTMRLMPPSNGFNNPITINGRKYTCVADSTVDVPDHDAQVMLANGWIATAGGGAAATASRPVNPPVGTTFHDTTLGKIIVWDGKKWRDYSSGAAV